MGIRKMARIALAQNRRERILRAFFKNGGDGPYLNK